MLVAGSTFLYLPFYIFIFLKQQQQKKEKKIASKEAEITEMRDCKIHLENEMANANCSDILFSCSLLLLFLLPIWGICVPAVEALP